MPENCLLDTSAILIHKDPEFAPLGGTLKLEMLPPKGPVTSSN